MTWKRIIRDLCIMLLVCGTFYGLSIAIEKTGGDSPTESSSFSPARIESDRLVESANWDSATDTLRTLTINDPHDGYAWYRLGVSYLQQRLATQSEIALLTSEGADELTLEPLQLQLAEQDRLAIETLEQSKQFLRYRGKSILHLACVYAQQNKFDKAMNHLQIYVDEGNWAENGLANIPELGEGGMEIHFDPSAMTPRSRLHQFHRFWRIVQQEYRQRSEYRYGRQ